jgi:hypothetical protein
MSTTYHLLDTASGEFLRISENASSRDFLTSERSYPVYVHESVARAVAVVRNLGNERAPWHIPDGSDLECPEGVKVVAKVDDYAAPKAGASPILISTTMHEVDIAGIALVKPLRTRPYAETPARILKHYLPSDVIETAAVGNPEFYAVEVEEGQALEPGGLLAVSNGSEDTLARILHVQPMPEEFPVDRRHGRAETVLVFADRRGADRALGLAELRLVPAASPGY